MNIKPVENYASAGYKSMNVSFKSSVDVTKLEMLSKVYRLESELLKMPQADIKTEHKFLPNIYERTITIPPWAVLTGAEHRTAYVVRLEKGVIAVNTDDGVKILTAPCEFSAPAGVKRVGRVFEQEVVWTDIYANADNCTDLSIIESRLYNLDYCELGENRVARLSDNSASQNASMINNKAIDFVVTLEEALTCQVG